MKKDHSNKIFLGLGILIVVILLFNVYTVSSLSSSLSSDRSRSLGFGKDIDDVELSSIRSTAQAVAELFPVDKIQTTQDAIDILIPSGTPEYGEALGVSFDDPINSLNKLHRQVYPQIKAELKQDPTLWQRYLNLATKPVGISCEFCCGIGPVGISDNGELRCGCSHNPAVQALTMWLIKNTDYTDQEILQEVLRWKALWFPKNMVQLGMQASNGEVDLDNLPGMVGGC